ncbi:hypothetical protein GCM10023238_08340 [Streptomyces heliomycini]
MVGPPSGSALLSPAFGEKSRMLAHPQDDTEGDDQVEQAQQDEEADQGDENRHNNPSFWARVAGDAG